MKDGKISWESACLDIKELIIIIIIVVIIIIIIIYSNVFMVLLSNIGGKCFVPFY